MWRNDVTALNIRATSVFVTGMPWAARLPISAASIADACVFVRMTWRANNQSAVRLMPFQYSPNFGCFSASVVSWRSNSTRAVIAAASGKKYKQCCIDRDFEWVVLDDGQIAKSVPVADEVKEIVKRGPQSGPVFANAPPLELIEYYIVESMRKAGVEPALIYAHEKTNGLLLNEQNIQKVPQKDVDEWEVAIDEHERTTGKKASRRPLSDEDMNGMMQCRPSRW